MKKIILMCTLLLCLLLCSCDTAAVTHGDVEEKSDVSQFVKIEKNYTWMVVYHKDTKVMYAVSCGYYNRGTFTLLVNADGTPMVYGG